MVRLLAASSLASLLCAPLAAVALHLAPVQLSVASSTGSSVLSQQLVRPHSLPAPVELPELSTLKLALEVRDEDGGKGVAPHQAALAFADVKSGKDVVLPLSVRANGKGKFSLDTAALPLSLRQTSGHLDVTLYLGGFDSESIAYRLFTLALPSTTLLPPPSAKIYDEALFSTFTKQKEIEWTFREDEPEVNPVLAAGGLAAVLAPWLVLLGITGSINVRKSLQPSSVPFLASLAFLEGAILAYWFSYMRLFRFLAVFAAGGVAAIVTGRPAVRVLKETKRV